MVSVLRMRAAQVSDIVRMDGLAALCKQIAFVNRSAIVVEKDLGEIVDRPAPLETANLKVVELQRNLVASGAYRFQLVSRRLKALYRLEQGFSGFALVRGDLVVGDMWCSSSETESDPKRVHADLGRFGFTQWDKTSVYAFDIFVVPSERKLSVAAAFRNAAMLKLRAKGFRKGFGFYWADNLLAHWCTHVLNKWNGVKIVKVSRFFLLTVAYPSQKLPDRICKRRDRQKLNIELFLPNVRSAFEAALHVEPAAITMDTEPGDIPAWDSIGHVTLAANLEQEFGVEFDKDDLMTMENVREICRVVQGKLATA
jgi:acyl carrier protein